MLVSDVVAAVQDDLRGQMQVGFIADSQLAGLVGSSVNMLNTALGMSLKIGGRESGRVVLTSTITPDIDIDSGWGMGLRFGVLVCLARGKTLLNQEGNLGRYRGPSHTADHRFRVKEARENSQWLEQKYEEVLGWIEGQTETRIDGLDFYAAAAASVASRMI